MAKLTLIVTRGGETRRYPVREDQPQIVGRGQDADILVSDVSVSRHQFTISHAGDSIDVQVSPQSRNQVLLNGHPITAGRVRPGDRLAVGYCAFEVVAETVLPTARPAAIPVDPAGPIDMSLVEEERRIAPRWMAALEDEEAKKKAAAAAQKKQQQGHKGKPVLERLALPLSMMVLLVLGGFYYYQRTRPPPVVFEPPQRLDLFADPPPVGCSEPEECFGKAKRSYELGVKLMEQSGADPATLFKAARQFQAASIALKGQNYRLPELQPRYEAARRKVITAFEDARLQLIRAQQEGNPSAALQAIEKQLALLEGSKHPYRDQLLRARARVYEVKESARREAIQSGAVFR